MNLSVSRHDLKKDIQHGKKLLKLLENICINPKHLTDPYGIVD